MNRELRDLDAAWVRGMTQRRISRRELIRYAGRGAGGLGLAAFLAACGVSGTQQNTAKKAPTFDWSKAKKAGQLNFANWPLYIDSSEPHVHPSLNLFEKQTGIKVNYRPVINENESFLATIVPSLQAGKDTGWDLMVITGGMPLNRLIRNNWLIPLDHSKLPNFEKYARPSVKDPAWDPGNRFSIAWQSGMTGIAYNSKRIDKPKSFHDLFRPEYKGKVGMFGDNLDLPNFTLLGLGIDPVQSTPEDWQKAADFLVALQTGTLEEGFRLTWNFGQFFDAVREYRVQFLRSLQYGAIATAITLLVSYPMAYWIAFHGGRRKTTFLFLLLLPFFVSFVIRTLSWGFILSDSGIVFGTFKTWGILPEGFRVLATPIAVVSGIAYNFLPFMALPLFVSLEKIDRRVVEAANDLYASKAKTFLRVILPLSSPGIFAGVLLTFVPAVGDFVNAEILGGTKTTMIGNVIQLQFLQNFNYPRASALSFILMAGMLIGIFTYARVLGARQIEEYV